MTQVLPPRHSPLATRRSDVQIILRTAAGSYFLDRPIECPECHTMHQVVRSAGGRTLCLFCADERDRAIIEIRNSKIETRPGGSR
jgi:hypothetical protein